MRGEESRNGVWIGEVGAHEIVRSPGLPGVLRDEGEPCLLEGDVVVVVDDVAADDVIAAPEQPQRDVEADETGIAGDENLHAANPITERAPRAKAISRRAKECHARTRAAVAAKPRSPQSGPGSATRHCTRNAPAGSLCDASNPGTIPCGDAGRRQDDGKGGA